MKKNFKGSILMKMLLGICLPTVIIYSIAIFGVLQIVEKPIGEFLQQNLADKSTTASLQISEFFTRQEEIAKQMSANCEFQQFLKNTVTGVKIQEAEGFKNIERTLDNIHAFDPEIICAAWVADEDSSQLYMSNDFISDKTFKIHERPWFKEMEKTNDIIMSEPYIDVATKKLVTTVAMPIFAPNSKKIIGAVGLDFSLDAINTMMKSYTMGKKGFFFLISKDEGVIYHPDDSIIGKSVSDMDISENIKSLLQSKEEGQITYKNKGENVYGYVCNISDTGWSVVSGLPQNEFHATRNTIRTSISIILGVGILILSGFIILISLGIVKPIKKLSKVTNELAQGKLDVLVDVKSKDEIGQLAVSMKALVDRLKMYIVYINEISDLLKEMGEGNLDFNFKQNYDGDFATIKNALLNTSNMLNNTLSEFNVAADQVACGSDQVSAGAQALSEGATEQASSIEELSANINEITSQIKSTADNALKAKHISNEANTATTKGQQQMKEMIAAMDEISNRSKEIEKIIKNIDSIAFQTNILALNAAVEAARAGAAGKGFAVVADEVRNLASKSAESAKDTAVLIESSLTAINNGTRIVAETAQSLEEVVSGSAQTAEVVQNIADASKEQAEFIAQVNMGIEQISAVVQTNSATAEESAASSEELSGQAQVLKELISKFKLKDESSLPKIKDID